MWKNHFRIFLLPSVRSLFGVKKSIPLAVCNFDTHLADVDVDVQAADLLNRRTLRSHAFSPQEPSVL